MKFHKGQLRKHNILTFVLMLFISNCRSTPEPIQQLPVTNTPYPTPTAVANTPTSLPVSSPTPTINVENKCLSLEETLPLDLKLEGVWVRQSGKPYLENLEENIKYRVPLYGGGILSTYEGHWSVSPNGEWLAYLDTILDTSGRTTITNGYSLRVIHSSGYSLSMDYWPISFQTIQGWIDNQNLLLKLDHRDIVLNPFSGKWYELKDPDWLNGLDIKKSWFDAKKYSPHLDQIVIHLNSHSEVRDVNSGEIIFGDSNLGFFTENIWSPDGVMLALATNNENAIYIFHENSEILKIDLVQSRLISMAFDGSVYLTNLKWSLNHQRLLIETFDELLILDVRERKIYEICFSDRDVNKSWGARSFFYSTDGQYIVSSRYLRDANFKYQIFDVLIDITNMRAYKLFTPRYNERIGWLALP